MRNLFSSMKIFLTFYECTFATVAQLMSNIDKRGRCFTDYKLTRLEARLRPPSKRPPKLRNWKEKINKHERKIVVATTRAMFKLIGRFGMLNTNKKKTRKKKTQILCPENFCNSAFACISVAQRKKKRLFGRKDLGGIPHPFHPLL